MYVVMVEWTWGKFSQYPVYFYEEAVAIYNEALHEGAYAAIIKEYEYVGVLASYYSI